MTAENSAAADAASPTTESVLFVDDEARILSSIRRLIRPLGVNAYFAESGQDGLKILEEHPIDLVVSDMRMPEMTGAEFLAKVKERWPKTVRMLLTGYADITSTIDALNNGGIYRYIRKPWDDNELKEIVLDGIKIRRLERERAELTAIKNKQNEELQDLNKNLEAKVAQRTQEIVKASRLLDKTYKELRESYDSFVRVFSTFAGSRETLQRGQSQLVADFAKRMAVALQLKEETIQATYYAALLHQIGKIGMPDSLLECPEEEMSEKQIKAYRKYPLIGEATLTAISGLERTAGLIRSHTEYMDGNGYPDKLEGNKIKSGARIIRAVRDYIGLQTGLIRKEKLSSDEAMAHLKHHAGIKYDPVVVKCLEHFRKDYDVSSLFTDEIVVPTHSLMPGMRLTKDLINGGGLLLISKGNLLTEKVIEKIMAIEKNEMERFMVHVSRERASDRE